MRILFITASYLPVINGVSYQIDILKKALEKLGHRVYVLAPSFPGYKEVQKNVVRFPSLPNPVVRKYPLGIPLVPLGKIKKMKPDVIHTHHPFIFGRFASLVSEKLSVPLFFTTHTQYEEYLNYYFPRGSKLASKIVKRDLKKLAEKCSRVICPSKNIKEKLESLGITNVAVINNAVENTFFRRPLKKSSRNPTLLYTGRLAKEKNPLFLLWVAKEIKKEIQDFRMLLIGPGSELSRLQNKVRQYKLEDNVFIPGEVSRHLLPDIYGVSHIFITASTSEVMPLSVIEASSCGLPTIALEKSGLDEVVLDNKTGYLLPPKMVPRKIVEVLGKPKLLSKLSKNAYQEAKKFSIDLKAKELEKLYKQTINQKD